MKIAGPIRSAIAFVALAAVVATGCGSSSNGGGGDDGGTSCYYTSAGMVCSSASSGGGASSGGFNLDGSNGGPSRVKSTCPGGGNTTISGRVYDPAMNNPLYNVTVYVPSGAVNPIMPGISCSCSDLYSPAVTSAVTDAGGNFKLVGTPDGANIPLIVQVGKWRRQYTLPNINKCADNTLPDKTYRLPKNHMEGDIPQIAISTGAADSLECLPMRMGLDTSEYVAGPGTKGGGHLHIYTGAGGVGGAALQGGTAYNPAATLWDQDSDMAQYDVVLFSCESQPTASINPMGQQVILDYANNGGRVFASHFHYALFNTGPFAALTPPLATWDTTNSSGGLSLNPDNDPMYGKIIQTLPNGMPFPEGVALNSWLGNVGALTNGELLIHYSRDNAEIGMANTPSQQWIVADQMSVSPGKYTQYFSFDTPTTGGDKCGRVVYSDLHVSGGPMNSADPNTDYPNFNPGIVPDQCTPHALTPQEKALEFMIFDLSSCLVPIGQPMAMPPPM